MGQSSNGATPLQPVELQELKHLKMTAKKQRKATGCKHHEALNAVARERGYKNWPHLIGDLEARHGKVIGDDEPDLTAVDEAFLRGGRRAPAESDEDDFTAEDEARLRGEVSLEGRRNRPRH